MLYVLDQLRAWKESQQNGKEQSDEECISIQS